MSIPEFGLQPITIRVLDKLGFITQSVNSRGMFSKQGKLAATGTLSSANLYVVDLHKNPVSAEKALTFLPQAWYHRLAHVNPAGIKQMVSKNF